MYPLSLHCLFRRTIGLRFVQQSHPISFCLKQFVFLGSGLCLQLPPVHTLRWIPCLRLVVGSTKPPQWTFTTQSYVMRGTLKKQHLNSDEYKCYFWYNQIMSMIEIIELNYQIDNSYYIIFQCKLPLDFLQLFLQMIR